MLQIILNYLLTRSWSVSHEIDVIAPTLFIRCVCTLWGDSGSLFHGTLAITSSDGHAERISLDLRVAHVGVGIRLGLEESR